MTKQLNMLLQKEMSRGEFLVTLGFGLASVMGLSTVLHLLTGKSMSTHFGHATAQASSYGASAYGGRKDGV